MAPNNLHHNVHDPVASGNLKSSLRGDDKATSSLDLPYANDRHGKPVSRTGNKDNDPERNSAHHALTQLGYTGLIPFGFGAVILWLSPWLVSPGIALTTQAGTLGYAGIIASYMAGMGAGSLLTRERGGLATYLPGMIATLIAWLMIVPDGYFFFSLSPVWRTLIMAMIFIFIYVQDTRMAMHDDWPRWYAQLRFRLTAWVIIALGAISARLLLWGMV